MIREEIASRHIKKSPFWDPSKGISGLRLKHWRCNRSRQCRMITGMKVN